MAFIPLIVCVVGLIMYVLAKEVKIQEIGKIMFWTGLLATLLHLPGVTH